MLHKSSTSGSTLQTPATGKAVNLDMDDRLTTGFVPERAWSAQLRTTTIPTDTVYDKKKDL